MGVATGEPPAMTATRIGRRRRFVFALVAATGSLFFVSTSVLAVDLYLHAKYERTASVNRQGYRGPIVGAKAPGEARVAVLGGSTAFGYGHRWEDSFPYVLERTLNVTATGNRFSVVNLAYNNEGAYAFRPTLEDYAYLDYDLVILYEGYNDLGDTPNYRAWRRDSGVFRMTGYMPILPMILREKAGALLYGDVDSAYRRQTVFRPNLARRAGAGALQAAAATVESLERQLGRLTRDLDDATVIRPTTGCNRRWQFYCTSVYDAIRFARDRRVGVIVGTQPYVSDRHIDQQNALMGMLRDRFATDAGVLHVNLGRTVDLRDDRLAFDGLHLTPAGNARIADALVEPVRRQLAILGKMP